MTEPRRRSLAKALSWRVIATSTTSAVAYAVTGNVALSLGVGLLDTPFKLVTYYGHERMWSWVRWGQKQKPTPPQEYSGTSA